jgi:hypothetical protein
VDWEVHQVTVCASGSDSSLCFSLRFQQVLGNTKWHIEVVVCGLSADLTPYQSQKQDSPAGLKIWQAKFGRLVV